MPIVGHIAETGMAVAAEFRGGPVSPNARNCEFVRQCERALPRGVEARRARIDAAGYQARIINRFTSRGIGYAIRARLDASVAGQTGALDESQRQPFIERDGAASLAQQTARFLHSMNGTPEASSAAVVRRRRKSGRQELEPGCPQAGDTLSQGGCICRALATSFCRRSDSRAFRRCSRRGDDSENRIRELRSGFGAAHPPCSDFAANALHSALCMLAFNLFALMRQVLDASCESMRIETFRRRPCCRAGKIVRHARGRALKLCDARAARRLSDAIGMIRAMALAPQPPETQKKASRARQKNRLRPGAVRTVIDLSPRFRSSALFGRVPPASPPGIAAANAKISPRPGFRQNPPQKNL